MKHIPRHVSERAAKAARQLAEGVDYRRLKGHQLKGRHGYISVPLGHRWRMVCRRTPDGIEVERVLSHEDYNREVDRR